MRNRLWNTDSFWIRHASGLAIEGDGEGDGAGGGEGDGDAAAVAAAAIAATEAADKEAADKEVADKDKDKDKDKEVADKDKDKDKEVADKDKDKDKDKEGAPEKYEDFKIPEGFEIDETRLAAFQEFGQKHQLSQEAAQEVVSLHTQVLEEFATAQQDQWEVIKTDWAKEVHADKALQDEGGKADAAIATASKAVEALGGQDLKNALELTGAGSHPAVVKAFYKLGQTMSEGKLIFGGDSVDTRSPAEKLYPSMTKT